MNRSISTILLVSILLLSSVESNKPRIKSDSTDSFEKKLSLEKPYSTVEGEKLAKEWSVNGNAAFDMNFVRLTSGLVFNSNEMTSSNWESVVQFTIKGKQTEGMAFWYVSLPGIPGDLFGSLSKFNGLGLFLHTAKNETLQDRPYLSVYHCDGSKPINPNSKEGQLLGCSLASKFGSEKTIQSPFNGKLKVRYFNGLLSLFHRFDDLPFVACGSSVPVKLPEKQRIMVSGHSNVAEEGFNVHSVRVFDLDPIAEESLAVIKEQLTLIEKQESDEHPFLPTKLGATPTVNNPSTTVSSSSPSPAATPAPLPPADTINLSSDNANKLAKSFHDYHQATYDFYNNVQKKLIEVADDKLSSIEKRTAKIQKISNFEHKRTDSVDMQTNNLIGKDLTHHVLLKDTAFGSRFEEFKNKVNDLTLSVSNLFADTHNIQSSIDSLNKELEKNVQGLNLNLKQSEDVILKSTEGYSKMKSSLGISNGQWFLVFESLLVLGFFAYSRLFHKKAKSRV